VVSRWSEGERRGFERLFRDLRNQKDVREKLAALIAERLATMDGSR
jgi:hypothetical protein